MLWDPLVTLITEDARDISLVPSERLCKTGSVVKVVGLTSVSIIISDVTQGCHGYDKGRI
jgi:hypothetical protein